VEIVQPKFSSVQFSVLQGVNLPDLASSHPPNLMEHTVLLAQQQICVHYNQHFSRPTAAQMSVGEDNFNEWTRGALVRSHNAKHHEAHLL
jgi:hypothetical protein